MERRKNRNLHVVREPEDPTDKIIDEIMDELNSEDGMRCANRPMSGERKTGKIPMGARESPAHMEV